MISWLGFRGIPPAQMNSMVPRTHMGRLLCPKTTFKTYLLSKFPQIQKIGVGPWPIPAAFPIPLGGQCLYCCLGSCAVRL